MSSARGGGLRSTPFCGSHSTQGEACCSPVVPCTQSGTRPPHHGALPCTAHPGPRRPCPQLRGCADLSLVPVAPLGIFMGPLLWGSLHWAHVLRVGDLHWPRVLSVGDLHWPHVLSVEEPSLDCILRVGEPSLAPCPERGEPSLAPCPERGPPHPELSVARPCHRCPFAHPVCLSCYCFICLSHSWNILSFVRAETSLIFLRFCTFSACRRAWDTCRAQGPFQGARSSLRLRKGLSGRGPPCLCPSPRAGGLEGTAGGPDPEPVGHASVHRSLLSDSRFVQTQNEDEPAVLPE